MKRIKELLELDEAQIREIIPKIMKVMVTKRNEDANKCLMEFILKEYAEEPPKLVMSTMICCMFSDGFYEHVSKEVEGIIKK